MTQSLPGTSGGPGNAQTSIIAIKRRKRGNYRLAGARAGPLVIKRHYDAAGLTSRTAPRGRQWR
jgi:hypothetical protein